MEQKELTEDNWPLAGDDPPAGDHYMLYWQEQSIIPGRESD